MRSGRLRGDLSLLSQGAHVAVHMGVRSLEGLACVAELIEHSVYERHSLTRTAEGLTFVLRNPPLRMGAFSSVRVLVDGAAVPPAEAEAQVGADPGITLDRIGRSNPFTLPVGQRTRISVRSTTAARARPRIRLELQSVAIPPLVWFEFSDVVGPQPPGV